MKMSVDREDHPTMQALVTADGILSCGTETFRAALGRGGVRADKREGDGATPLGLLPLRQVLYRADRCASPVCAVPTGAIAPDCGWCDDPAHAGYNQKVRLPIDGRAETLWRDDPLYDIIGVLGWNDAPVRPGCGSAIFLHVAEVDFGPTEGCVAMAPDDLRRVLAMGLTGVTVRCQRQS
jgi:L,D-peptidoglycan transpeptidase YkuD (ErfK/YbiS/YcfS/YnhG family)